MEKNICLDEKGILNFFCVHEEKDLHPERFIKNVRLIINSPPRNGRCVCCGKHIRQLKPYKSFGQLFDGALLMKTFRNEGPYNDEAEKAMKEAVKQFPDDPLVWFIKIYGKKKGTALYSGADAHSWIVKSWECKDCIGLNDEKYFKMRGSNPLKKEKDVIKQYVEIEDINTGLVKLYKPDPIIMNKFPILIDTITKAPK